VAHLEAATFLAAPAPAAAGTPSPATINYYCEGAIKEDY